MEGSFIKILCDLTNLNWYQIIQIVTGILTFGVALCAYNSWRKQNHSKAVITCLDELSKSVYEFSSNIQQAIEILRFIHIGIDSQHSITNENHNLKFNNAITFINEKGIEYANRLQLATANCFGHVSNIHFLTLKSELFKVSDYEKLKDTTDVMIQQYNRLNATIGILSNQNTNWSHPLAEKALKNFLRIKPDEISELVENSQSKIYEILDKNYKKEFELKRNNKKQQHANHNGVKGN